MLLRVVVAGAMFALALGGAAHAQVACKTAGDAAAGVVPSSTGDLMRDMLVSISAVELLDKGFSYKKLKKQARCERGGFDARGATYRLHGENGAKPPRFALTPDAGAPFAFLNADKDVGGNTRYALTVARGADAWIVRLYDAIPADAALIADMIVALEGGYMPMVARTDGQVSINVNTDAYVPPASQPNMPPPSPGTGPGQPLVSSTPDGAVFEGLDDGGARHRLTGFVCPGAIEGFTRTKTTVFDAAEGGRDVSCNFAGERSWFTLYLTRLPANFTGEKVFATYVEQAQTVAPPVAPVEPLVAPGAPPAPSFAAFWTDRGGQVQGLWMTQIGRWHIKLRVTYAPGDQAAVKAFTEAIYKAVFEQVKGPEV